MKVSQAVDHCLRHHRVNSRINTIRSNAFVLVRLREEFGDREIVSITSDELLDFLTRLTDGKKQSTKRTRYSCLKAFFNFSINTTTPGLRNPCNTPIMKKLFQSSRKVQWTILEKDVVDEIIFRTTYPRNRLMLELMARAGMRVSEVLHLTPADIDDCKLRLNDPKSGREVEVVYVHRKLADRLKDYVRDKSIEPEQRVFPLTYAGARLIVRKAGTLVGASVRPHDLRRHAATYASRCGTPIEIVSKVILRHANLSTTQRYLGKVSDVEARRWIENLHG